LIWFWIGEQAVAPVDLIVPWRKPGALLLNKVRCALPVAGLQCGEAASTAPHNMTKELRGNRSEAYLKGY